MLKLHFKMGGINGEICKHLSHNAQGRVHRDSVQAGDDNQLSGFPGIHRRFVPHLRELRPLGASCPRAQR